MSEGDWVTLGYFEQHDVADVLAYLRSNGETTRHTLRRCSGVRTVLTVLVVCRQEQLFVCCCLEFVRTVVCRRTINESAKQTLLCPSGSTAGTSVPTDENSLVRF